MTFTWTGPQYPPPPFLDKDVLANLKKEEPPRLRGILEFVILVFLALIAGGSYVAGAYVYAIVALVLIFLMLGLLATRNIREVSPNWKGFLAGLATVVLGFMIVYWGRSIAVMAVGASVLVVGGLVAFLSFWD
jgi:hypothetical protein